MSVQHLVPRSLRAVLKPAKSGLLNSLFGYDFHADGLAVGGHNLDFLADQKFKSAWEFAVSQNQMGYFNVPDIRWRAHVACWATQRALELSGDFVECGVHMGLLSHTVCHFLDFEEVDRVFWLFDTFEGIPLDQVSSQERMHAQSVNQTYFDCFDYVSKSFARYPNVKLVKGCVPDSLPQKQIASVAYLSLDMNNAFAEVKALEWFWPKMTKGAVILLDDYGFGAHHVQKGQIDNFLATKGKPCLTLPTGQGLVVM